MKRLYIEIKGNVWSAELVKGFEPSCNGIYIKFQRNN